jgi:ABC-type branched-subunit amino acid transport system substrate-binding protein
MDKQQQHGSSSSSNSNSNSNIDPLEVHEVEEMKGRVLQERKELGYYDTYFESKLAGGDFELLGPGVTRLILEDGTSATFRHVDAFYPFFSFSTEAGIEQMGALLMAAYHFNNRVSSIVPRLGELESCNIKFSVDALNSWFDIKTATSQLYSQVLPRNYTTATDVQKAKYPTGLLGAFSSAVSASLSILAGASQLTQVSFASSSTALDNKDIYPYFGRIVTSVDGSAGVLAEYLAIEHAATHVYVVYSRYAYGTDYAVAFRNRAAELGIVTLSSSLSVDCTSASECDEYKTVLDAIKASGFRYVFAILQPNDHFLTFVPEAKQAGLIGDDYFWTFGYTKGSVFSGSEELAIASNRSAIVRSAEGERLEAFPEYLNEWQAYIATDAGNQALHAFLPPVVSPANNYSDYVLREDTTGTVFTYDSFMALAIAACDAAEEHGDVFTPDQFHKAFLNAKFVGVTGNVEFDPTTGTRAIKTTPFTISNYIADSEASDSGAYSIRAVDTHIYNGVAWERIEGQPEFLYADGTTTIPSNLPPLTPFRDEIMPWASIAGLIACALIVSTTLGFCGWMQWHREADPIRAAQPFFVWMLAIGVILMATSLIPQAALPVSSIPDAACMISPWFLSVGYCVAFAALFSKLMRINTIDTSSKRLARVAIQPQHALKPFALLITLNLIILIAWTVVSPLEYKETSSGDIDEYGRTLSYSYSCTSDNAIWFRVCIGFLDVMALLYAAYQGYRASFVKMAYNESKYILVALIISSQSFFIGVPGVIAAGGNPSAGYFCRTIAVLWGCFGIIMPICFPKLYQLKKWQKAQEEKERKRMERLDRTNRFFKHASSVPSDHTPPSSFPLSSHLGSNAAKSVVFSDNSLARSTLTSTNMITTVVSEHEPGPLC